MSRQDLAPPKFVPTLTEVVSPLARSQAPASVARANPGVKSPETLASVMLDEQAWTARIMQDVDVTLESKLRLVVANVVSEQIAIMVPTLRNEIEQSVRNAVREALARQLR